MTTPLLVGTLPDLDDLARALTTLRFTLGGGLTWQIQWRTSSWHVVVGGDDRGVAIADHPVLLEACRLAINGLGGCIRIVEES
jgi:hypothetical protein